MLDYGLLFVCLIVIIKNLITESQCPISVMKFGVTVTELEFMQESNSV